MDWQHMMEELDGLCAALESGEQAWALARAEALRELVRTENEGVDFKAVVDNLLDGVYVTDGNAVTQYVNPAYTKHTGIQPEEIIGRSVTDIVAEGTLFKKAVSADVIRLRRNVTGTGFIRTLKGKQIHAYVTGVPLFDRNGEVKNVVVSVFDTDSLRYRVTEFRNAMQAGDAVQIVERFEEDAINPMVGSDPSIQEIRRTIARAAATDVTILITGESGVGKESVADRVYSLSRRKGKPYVKVNCAAIPGNLLESELFGYEKGAFTGASKEGKTGLFERANHGTILLDEIGDLPYELQTKLLRALQQKEIMRIGGVKPISLDVRVIAATNADLKKKIKDGTFREDLYYRLSVVPVHVPPLRERRGDIAKLVKHYFFEYCTKHAHTVTVPDEAMMIFESYDWPGNVRELQNVIEYMVICSESNVLDSKALANYLGMKVDPEALRPVSLHSALESYEKKLIETALSETGGVRKAAAFLHVDPSTISRKARKYGIPMTEA
ncbi:MAG: sigma 54-interacting transcriptional regulator [Oscillospiraceae bacterium]|nr:sigma 54-interacting transcriptional regulator [Oscillospiraceae bacterium]